AGPPDPLARRRGASLPDRRAPAQASSRQGPGRGVRPMAARLPAEIPAGLEAAPLPADAIEVGRIADAWGVKGWFKVVPHSASPEALFSSRRWFIQPSERGSKTFAVTLLLRIREGQEHSDSLVA